MAINLADKYEKKLDERFTAGSYTEKWCGTNYNWDGVNAIKVWTLVTGELTDYTASGNNRYGTPTEVDDELNIYTLTKKRSFANTFDVTNVQDQMFIKKANAYLKQMWDERYIPEVDLCRFTAWANGAATVVVSSTALTKDNIVTELRTGFETLDNAFVPSEGRVIFMTPAGVTALMTSKEMQYQKWTQDVLIKGKVGEFSGAPVVQVPTSRLPKGCNFIIKYKNASADPMKLRKLHAHENPPGIAGTLMEGLCRFDSFVLANKADGIYCHFASNAVATPTVAVASGKATLTCGTSGAVIKYTVDGTNPKVSPTAQTYSAAFAVETGATIKAYASLAGNINSGILVSKA